MADILVQYVLDNIWCAPGQDKELVLKPKKVHGPLSVFGTFRHLGREISLPSLNSSWFVYQIGTYYESDDQLKLYQKFWEYETWRPLTKPMISDGLMTTVFTSKGITFPLFRTYYMYTKEKALLLAVELNNKIPANPMSEDVFIRFYQNAFRDSVRSEGTDYRMRPENRILATPEDITFVNNRITQLVSQRGQCLLSINGQRYKKPDFRFVSAGDIVEWIYDPTIEFVETYVLSNTGTYFSALDSDTKVVLHSPSRGYFDSISFFDDLEVEVYTPLSQTGGFYGAYFPLFDETSMRMLTHRDYAIRQSVLTQVMNSVSALNPSALTENFRVEVKFRKSGFTRPIVKTTSLVDDLYNLNDNGIIAAFTQNPIVFPIFSGSSMENSPYVRAMKAPREEITEELAEDVLGYNLLTQMHGVGAIRLTSNITDKTALVPDLYQSAYTAYEYNFSGQFLLYASGLTGPVFTAEHPSANMVELLRGIGGTSPSAQYGDNNLILYPDRGYRVWACNKIDGVPNFIWTDITDTNQYTEDRVNNTISWSNPNDPRYMMVRDDSAFVVRAFNQIFNTHLMTFQLLEYVDQGTGAQEIVADVCPSDITLFMNSRSLIRGVDYFVNFPNVYITNFAYLTQDLFSSNQIFHYRLTGLGDGSGQPEPVFDVGSVSHGFVGTGIRYIPKNDKPVRVVIDGYMKLPSTIRYSQDDLTFNDPVNILNGLPYEVKGYTIPLSDFLEENQEPTRINAVQTDRQLIDYMSLKIDGPLRSGENLAPPTKLVCPFHAKITDDILNGTITDVDTDPSRTDTELLEIAQGYFYLTIVSPCNDAAGINGNPQFLMVPHPRVGKVNLGNSVRVTFITRISEIVFPGIVKNMATYYV